MWFSCIQLFTNCRNKASKHQLPEVKTSTGGSTLYQKAIIQSQTGSSIHNGNKFPKQKGQLLINCLLSDSLLWMEAVWKVSFWQGRLLKGKGKKGKGKDHSASQVLGMIETGEEATGSTRGKNSYLIKHH